jgi:hypothetical protein
MFVFFADISAATIRVPVASRRLPSRAQAFCCLTWRLHWKSVSWGLKNHLGDSMVCKNCTQKSCKVLLRKSSTCRFEYLESWTLGDLGGLFFAKVIWPHCIQTRVSHPIFRGPAAPWRWSHARRSALSAAWWRHPSLAEGSTQFVDFFLPQSWMGFI